MPRRPQTGPTTASVSAARRSSRDVSNTAWGVPAAHQTRSKRRSDSSTIVGRSESWPSGGMPPIAKPVARLASSAFAGRASRSVTRRSPAQSTIVARPSSTNTSDLTICPTSQPHVLAASTAVRVEVGSTCTWTSRPRAASRSCTFAAVGCTASKTTRRGVPAWLVNLAPRVRGCDPSKGRRPFSSRGLCRFEAAVRLRDFRGSSSLNREGIRARTPAFGCDMRGSLPVD